MSTDEYAPCIVYLFSYVIVSIAYLCLTADFQVKPVLASSPQFSCLRQERLSFGDKWHSFFQAVCLPVSQQVVSERE